MSASPYSDPPVQVMNGPRVVPVLITHFARQGQVDLLLKLERRTIPSDVVNKLMERGRYVFREGRLWFVAPMWLKVMHDTCYSDAYHQQYAEVIKQRNLEALTSREFPKE